MTRAADRVNPLARDEEPLAPAPALNCPHPDDCACHVDVDHTAARYRTFEQRLDALGKLQDNGLFVAVCGTSSSGKTSLINRCVARAKRTLDELHVVHAVVDLSILGRGARITALDRVDMVRDRLVSRVRGLQHVFDESEYRAPEEWGPRKPVLEEYMAAVSDALVDNAALIVVTPRTDNVGEVMEYWSGTFRKMLIFSETTCEDLSHISPNAAGEARSCILQLGLLKPGDTIKFLEARIHVDGRGRAFPDLDFDAINTFFGDPPMATIGMLQNLLYRTYEHYVDAPWPPENIIRLQDVQNIIAALPEGQEG